MRASVVILGALLLCHGREALSQEKESQVHNFVVTHMHGWGASDGVLRLSTGRVTFAEKGSGSNADHAFEIPCSEIADLSENGFKNFGADRKHLAFHIKFANNTYNFIILRTDYTRLREEYLTEACPP
jgi:hypothetical protein